MKETMSDGLSRLGVDLPRSLHQRIKAHAATRGERLQDLVLRALQAELAHLERKK